jgi:3-hydroxy acid dehydrogenase/malonic semialdehyde reductase
VQRDRDKLRDSALLHRHAVQQIGDLHGALVVGDEDELSAIFERVQRPQESVDVDLVEGGVGLIQNAERRRPVLEDREQQRQRHQGALAARKQADILQFFAGRLGEDFNTGIERILRILEPHTGLASTKQLAKNTVEVTVDRLETLAQECGCIPHALDVRDRDAVAALGDKIEVDILVNNAGLGRAMGSIWAGDPADVDLTVDTNVTAAIHVIRAVLPGMIDRGRGHIVNMSSVMGLRSGPGALYGATKGAMHMLSQDLRHELKGTRVRVTEICPGRVSTEFYDVAIDDEVIRAQVKDRGTADLRADDIAAAVVYATSAPWRVNVSLLEIMPTEQTYGGASFAPVPGAGYG